MPRRRTFATAIHGLRSLDGGRAPASCLRRPIRLGGSVPGQRRLSGHGQPLTDASGHTTLSPAPGPEGRVSTSRRRSAKRLAEDGHPPVRAAGCHVSRVYSHGQPLTDAESHKSPRRKPGDTGRASDTGCRRSIRCLAPFVHTPASERRSRSNASSRWVRVDFVSASCVSPHGAAAANR